jgi:hypothetical protein
MDLHPYDTVCHDTTRHDKVMFKIFYIYIYIYIYREREKKKERKKERKFQN